METVRYLTNSLPITTVCNSLPSRLVKYSGEATGRVEVVASIGAFKVLSPVLARRTSGSGVMYGSCVWMKFDSVCAPSRTPMAFALSAQAFTPAMPPGKNFGLGS